MSSSRESTEASSLCPLCLIHKVVDEEWRSMRAGGGDLEVMNPPQLPSTTYKSLSSSMHKSLSSSVYKSIFSPAPLRRACHLSRHRRPPHHSPLRLVRRPRQHPTHRLLLNLVHILTVGALPPAVVISNVDALVLTDTDGYGLIETRSCLPFLPEKAAFHRKLAETPLMLSRGPAAYALMLKAP